KLRCCDFALGSGNPLKGPEWRQERSQLPDGLCIGAPYQSSSAINASRAVRRIARSSRLWAAASAVYRPCFVAFWLPLGAPLPAPCIRQTRWPLTAGAWHRLPDRREVARQRFARCMGNLLCMGLILRFCRRPLPPRRGIHFADDRLPARMDVDVFHRHLLFALAAVTLQRLHLRGVGPQQLYGDVAVRVLLLDRVGTFELAQAAHGGRMDGDHLRRQHGLYLIARSDAVHGGERAVYLPFLERLRCRAPTGGFEKLQKRPRVEIVRCRPKRHEAC